jgi:hypothetical protein
VLAGHCSKLATRGVPGVASTAEALRALFSIGGPSPSAPTGVVAQGGQPARHGTLGVTLSGPSSCHCSSDRAAGSSEPGHAEPAPRCILPPAAAEGHVRMG